MKAILSGAFDPFTLGHRDIAERAARLYDRVVIAVAEDTGKTTADLATRQKIAQLSVQGIQNAEVVAFSGLLPDFLKANMPCVSLRGLRGGSDLQYERDLCEVYGSLCDTECVYLFADPAKQHISSSVVRRLARLDADLTGYVYKSAIDTVKKHYGTTGGAKNAGT